MTQAITIIVDGDELDTFTEASVTKSIETLFGTFVFQATNEDRSKLIDWRLKVGRDCQVKVAGKQVINGYIDKVIIGYNADSHYVQVSGRDRTADLVDSTFGDSGFDGELTLKQLVEQVLAQFNLSDIRVIDDVGTAPFDATEFLSIQYGTSVFKFLEKYAMKRQVLLTTNGDGDIVFLRLKKGAKTRPLLKTHISLDANMAATILEGRINYDWSKRYNQYFCDSQSWPFGASKISDNPEVQAKIMAYQRSDVAVDNEIRNSRIYHFDSDSSDIDTNLTERAKWEGNFRRVQSEVWTYTLQGHTAKDDGEIWKPGFDVIISDRYANVSHEVLISSVTYLESGEGTKTSLKLLSRDAFSVDVNKAIKDKNTDGINQYLTTSIESTRERVRKAAEDARKQL